MTLEETIKAQFYQAANDQNRQLSPLYPELKLLDCGLDSLSFGLIVARLEDELGFDPFAVIEKFPVTFGDFVKLYEKHAK